MTELIADKAAESATQYKRNVTQSARKVTESGAKASESSPNADRRKAGRKSNEERARIAAEAERAERAAAAEAERKARIATVESRRATRLQPDTKLTLAVTLALAGIVLATSFAISYSAMVAVAGWMRLPLPWLAFVVPGFIEILTVFAALDVIVSRSRGRNALVPLLAMVVLSAVAVTGNVSHTLAAWSPAVPWEGWVGVLLSGTAPLVVLYATERVSALVFAEPERGDI